VSVNNKNTIQRSYWKKHQEIIANEIQINARRQQQIEEYRDDY